MTRLSGKPRGRAAAGFLLGFLLARLLSGCSSPPPVDLTPDPVPLDKTVVLLNGERLSPEEFDTEFRMMQIHYSAVSEDDMLAIKRHLFEQVINRWLLLQEARRIGLTMSRAQATAVLKKALQSVPDDFWTILKARGVSPDAWKRRILQEKLASEVVDREVNSKVHILPGEVREYYWDHLGQYWQPPAVHVRHIVVKSKSDLRKVLASLKKGDSFQKVAATFSIGPERNQGGDWGFMDLDRVPQDYQKLLAGLKPGGVTRPFRDGYGYHLFQLLGRRPRRMRTFAEVKGLIHDSLLKEEEDLRFDQWMADLKKKSTIKVNQEMAPVIGVIPEDLSEPH